MGGRQAGPRLSARRTLTRLLLPALLLTSACRDQAAEPAEPAALTWTPATGRVATTGVIWAQGSRVHFPDGRIIDAGMPIGSFVVAGDGIYFVAAASEQTARPVLRHATFDEVEDTGVRLEGESFGATADGRYLVYLARSGGRDRHGTPQAQVGVVDLETGEQTVASSEGMGDPGRDDLDQLYGESGIGLAALTTGTVYVDTAGPMLAYDLATGREREVDPLRIPDDAGDTGPDGAWRIDRSDDERPVLVGTRGERVRPQVGTARWGLSRWLDARTVLAFAVTPAPRPTDGPPLPSGQGEDTAPATRTTFLRCRVPDGRCTPVPGLPPDAFLNRTDVP